MREMQDLIGRTQEPREGDPDIRWTERERDKHVQRREGFYEGDHDQDERVKLKSLNVPISIDTSQLSSSI